VYPALAVLQRLKAEFPEIQTLWVGSLGGMEADLVKRAKVEFTAIPAAGVHGVGLRALPGNLVQLGRGLLAARGVLRQYRPQALLFTGGFVAFPVALAARLPGQVAPRPRSLVYVPDIEPGLALKAVARMADQIAVTTDESRAYFSPRARLVVTGYPTRPDLAKWDNPRAAREALGCDPALPTLLVFGGSKGARSINRALLPILPELLSEMQVIHISGQLDWAEVQAARVSLPAAFVGRYHAYAYLHDEMGAALAAADLVVSRAGASTLGEFPLFGLPAILVPYPYAWRYQMGNARYLVERGAAVILADAELPAGLLPLVRSLLNDTTGLAKMRHAMRSLARSDSAGRIAALLAGLGGAE
jgi:UDP-N-acetylglucosamine--N-acetylmuramyl-(pentapeptide) pyrophosphoryl-undecaprenol N-acetylglucosamine transferase